MQDYSHKLAKQIVNETVKACKKELRLKKHELRALHSFKVIISEKAFGSYGGYGSIKIGLDRTKQAAPLAAFVEYKRIAADNIIGGFIDDDWRNCLKATVCHEVAHEAITQYKYNKPRPLKTRTWTPHGTAWQYVYAILRRSIVNPNLKSKPRAVTWDERNNLIKLLDKV